MVILLLFLFIPNPLASAPEVNANFTNRRADFTWDWVGPEGGELLKVIVDPQNQNLAFAFSQFDVWRTTDGTQWSNYPQFRYREPAGGAFVSLNRAMVAFHDSIYLTTDGGNAWSQVNYDFGIIYIMTDEPGDTALIVGETAIGFVIHYTFDGGNSFDSLTEFSNTYLNDVFSIAFDADSTIFLACCLYYPSTEDTCAVLRSTDLGQNWTVVFSENDSLEFGDVADIELNPFNPQELFLSLGMEGGPLGLFCSSDNGDNWDTYGKDDGLFFSTDVEFINNDSIVVTSPMRAGIYIGGRAAPDWSFTKVDSNYSATDIEGSAASTWYCSAIGAMMKSTDNGNTWFDVTSGIKALMVGMPGIGNYTSPLNGKMYAVSFMGNVLYRTTDGGQTWNKKTDRNIFWRPAIEVFPGNPDLLYTSGLWVDLVGVDTIAYDFFVSTDAGASWDTVHQAPHPDSAIIFSAIHASPTDPTLLLGRQLHFESEDSEAVYLSTNQGSNWTKIMDDVDGPIIGTDTIFVFEEDVILYSFDCGMNWDTLINGIFVFNYDYDPDDQFLYAITTDSLVRIHLDSTIELLYPIGPSFYTLVNAHGNDNLFITLISSLFQPMFMRSDDAGSTFVVDTLDFLPFGIAVTQDEVLLADMGKSFWRSTDATGIKSVPARDPVFQLRVYPSVFSNRLMFEKEERLPIRARIYDISGRLVDSFILGKKLTVWRKKVPAGVYFYILGEQRICGKVVKID